MIFGRKRPDRRDYEMTWEQLQSEMAKLNMETKGVSLTTFAEEDEDNQGKDRGIELLRSGQ